LEILITGLLLFAAVHFIPSKASSLKLALVGKLGSGGYQGVFSLLLILALTLIVYGWRHTTPEYIYALPMAVRTLTSALMLLALILFVASKPPTRIKRFIRHPQLTGVVVWAVAHLLSNGDSRSLVLFGGLGLWAILEIIFINQREGAWVKPDAPPWSREVILLVIAAVVFAGVIWAHPWLAGVPVF